MLTALAFRFQRVVFALVLVAMGVGVFAYFTLPAREDPAITIREAVVSVVYPGQTPERMERLVTRPLEQAARKLPEVDEISSSSLPGLSIVSVEVGETYDELDQIWDDLRDEIDAVRADLPAGAFPPTVTDDVGEVSVVTLALVAPDFSMGELGEMVEHVRDRLYEVAGVRGIDIFGEVPERIEVTLDDARLAELGLSPGAVSDALSARNIVRPGGQVDLGPLSLLVEPTGDYDAVADIGDTLISTPAGEATYLRDIAAIERTLQDPPEQRAYMDGERAIIVAISMLDGERVLKFGPRLAEKVDEIEAGLPVGYTIEQVTFQADAVAATVFGVTINVSQTIILVCVVVILLLGLRSGLIVGAIVPTVMLATIGLFGIFGVSLERMSLATLVIALGLFVDNGIVVAEDFRRRLADGVHRDEVMRGVGRELALPLGASTATTILVFLPLMLAPSTAGEYTRSISIVVAISLTLSWAMAMTLTPILCHRFLQVPDPDAKRPINERMFDPLKAAYGRALRVALAHRVLFLLGTGAALVAGVAGVATAPKKFFPDSDRAQLITYITLPSGVSTDRTDAVMRDVMASMDAAAFPWLASNAVYVGFGGPRFVLSLTPVDPAPNRAVMITNVTERDAMDGAVADLRDHLATHPEVRATVTRMFLGPSDSNVIEVEVRGPDPAFLLEAASKVEAILAGVSGAIDISHDWEGQVPRLKVDVDQARARAAGVTSAAIAEALSRNVSGLAISEFREGDDVIPILARGPAELRADPAALETLPIFGRDGRSVPLAQVASIEVVTGFSRIERQDLIRAVTVEGRSTKMAAEDIAAEVRGAFAELSATFPPGHALEVVGVVKESAESGASLGANMPLCFGLVALLLVCQFNSFRRAGVVLLTMPLVIVGVALGLHVMQAAFGFMVILGILSLFGIILNNAIVLIDRIDIERAAGAAPLDAVVDASSRRLRPIVMTTITTVLGLLPLIVANDPLFYGFASVVAFGLVAGTVLTLGVVPVLYALFTIRPGEAAVEDEAETGKDTQAAPAAELMPTYGVSSAAPVFYPVSYELAYAQPLAANANAGESMADGATIVGQIIPGKAAE